MVSRMVPEPAQLAAALRAGGEALVGDEPGPPLPSLFEQLVKHPTGRNGYEDLLRAADELHASKPFTALWSRQDQPLSLRRQVLKDPAALRALALLRRGLQKPMLSVRQGRTPAESASLSVVGFAGFRNLGRLLSIEQRVYFPDGPIRAALESVHQSLRFSRALQMDSLVSGMTGHAIGAMGIKTLGTHLDRLAAADCEHLWRICRFELAQPDPLPRILELERAVSLGWLAEIAAAGRTGLEEFVGDPVDDQDDAARQQTQRLRDEVARVATVPGAISNLLAGVRRQLDASYDRALAESKKPSWQRTWDSPPEESTLEGRLLATLGLLATNHRVSDRYASVAAQLRLSACHAAVRRYRWERDQLPASLAILDLGAIAVDPFSGEQFRYEVTGRRYRLESAGPAAETDDPQAVDGRRPVSITPAD